MKPGRSVAPEPLITSAPLGGFNFGPPTAVIQPSLTTTVLFGTIFLPSKIRTLTIAKVSAAAARLPNGQKARKRTRSRR